VLRSIGSMAKLPLPASRVDVFALSSGILIEGDYLSLADGVHVQLDHLVDDANGARHQLHPLAVEALESLAAGTEAKSWLVSMLELGLSPAQITEMLAFLGSVAALRIRRTPMGTLRHLSHRAHTLALGVRLAPVARRWPATPSGLLIACTRALLPLLIALTAVGLLWSVAFSAAATLWVSVVIHEAAHCLPIQSRSAILQRGLRLGVLHPLLPARANLISALAGPLCGAAAAMILTPGALGGLIALLHLASLLPISNDGRVLARHWAGVRT
jgi:hypothetical protein